MFYSGLLHRIVEGMIEQRTNLKYNRAFLKSMRLILESLKKGLTLEGEMTPKIEEIPMSKIQINGSIYRVHR